jgi:hypothetical protein
MSQQKIDPQLLLWGAAGLAVLYLTYRTTKAAGGAVDSVTHAVGSAADAVGGAVGNAWQSLTDLWGEDPQYADITKSQYTPSQVAKIMPARTVELVDSPATGPTFGGIANGDVVSYWTDPTTRIGVGPIGWQSTNPTSNKSSIYGSEPGRQTFSGA